MHVCAEYLFNMPLGERCHNHLKCHAIKRVLATKYVLYICMCVDRYEYKIIETIIDYLTISLNLYIHTYVHTFTHLYCFPILLVNNKSSVVFFFCYWYCCFHPDVIVSFMDIYALRVTATVLWHELRFLIKQEVSRLHPTTALSSSAASSFLHSISYQKLRLPT